MIQVLALNLWLAIGIFSTPVSALEVPAHTAPVVDLPGLFTPEEKLALSNRLRDYQRKAGPQIQILVISSLEGESLEGFSLRVAEAWKLGDAKRDDGILFLVAIKERKVRIEVGQGLEGQIPDVLAGRIIRSHIAPYFKQGKYYQGLSQGIEEVIATLAGERKEKPEPKRSHSKLGSVIFFLFLLLFMTFPALLFRILSKRPRLGRKMARWGGEWTGFGYRGGDFSGSYGSNINFGGGFMGGGGGGFSGGGSSGRW